MGEITNLPVYIVTLVLCLLLYFKQKYSYWRNKNVHFIEPQIPFGTSGNPFNSKRSAVTLQQDQYYYFKSRGLKFGGLYMFLRPYLLIVDLDLVRHVMSKDFLYFSDRGMYYNEKDDPLSAHVFNLEGDKWRPLRAKLTQTFTSGKIKNMFPTLLACGNPLIAAMNEYASKNGPIDIKDIAGRFTTDVIGSCAFGLECNSFKEPEDEVRKYGRMVLELTTKLEVVKFLIALSNPSLARRLGICITLESKKFFLEVVKMTVTYRNNNNVVRNDFLQLLMDLKDPNSIRSLTIKEIAAQAFIFWIAGFETSSTAMTFCLFELASNQEIQARVREEITTVLGQFEENITYDAVMSMKYLNQVVEETLRKYPPGIMLFRVCQQDYQIPGTDIIIEKGTRFVIPIYAIQHDPEYFPDPENFDPERFNEQNRANVRPFSYMPFGEGPRNCMGLRFGLLQVKVGLVLLLRNYKFLLNSRTQLPLEFDRVHFFLKARGDIWLDIERLRKQ